MWEAFSYGQKPYKVRSSVWLVFFCKNSEQIWTNAFPAWKGLLQAKARLNTPSVATKESNNSPKNQLQASFIVSHVL